MNIRLREDEVEGLVSSPPTTVLKEIVDAARRGYCNLYSNSPSWAFAKNTFILPIVTRTLNRFCGDFPPPPPPPQPGFTGGQCGIDYNIDITFDFFPQFSSEVATQTQNISSFNLGPFSEFRGIIIGQDDVIRTFVTKPGGTEQILGSTSSAGVGSIVQDSWFWTLTPSDGSPDVCGNPPNPPYPELPPPTVADRTINVDITNSNNETNNYTGIINADTTGQVTFPPTINIGGIAVSIDIGGAIVNNDNSRRSGGGGAPGSEKVASDEEPPPSITQEEEQPEEETPPPKTVENLIAITIAASGSDELYDSTSGRGGPDVFYIGWVEFKNKGFYYPREYIHFKNTRFQAPEENDGYAITYRKGWSGTVTEIVENIEPA